MNGLTDISSDLTGLLRLRADEAPDRIAYRCLDSRGVEQEILTWGRLRQRAKAVAGRLGGLTAPGDRVMLLHSSPADFVTGLFGCLEAGLIAVPAPYPSSMRGSGRKLERLSGILDDARPAVTLTSAELAAELDWQEHARFGHVLVVSEAAEFRDPLTSRAVAPGQPAILQYTSGSTSDPKGVMVSHRNFMHNFEMLGQLVFGALPDLPRHELRLVSWLPLFHDMGLAQVFIPLFSGGSCSLMPPLAFVLSPYLWLRTISDQRAHFSTAPDFAYGLCASRITPEQRDSLDLSAWSLALNGSEQVRFDTLKDFAGFFGPCGFQIADFAPCYGLAESTVFVSGVRRGAPPSILLDRRSLEEGRVVVCGDAEAGRRVVASGMVADGITVRIVDPETGIECREGMVGEIWVAGDSVSAGYWRRPGENKITFGAELPGEPGRFLRTGDLGFHHDDHLYIVGRIKDLIIVDGRNHHPNDIELTATKSHAALEGCTAAAIVSGEDDGSPIVIIVESRPDPNADSGRDPGRLEKAVRRAVAQDHGLSVARLVLVQPNSLPRTTSGKTKRGHCSVLFRSGRLKTWWPESRSEEK